MSVLDLSVGYPVHAVASYAQHRNPNSVLITPWTATCGATGEQVGPNPFRTAQSARRLELCKGCWPAGHGTYHPAPVRTDKGARS